MGHLFRWHRPPPDLPAGGGALSPSRVTRRAPLHRAAAGGGVPVRHVDRPVIRRRVAAPVTPVGTGSVDQARSGAGPLPTTNPFRPEAPQAAAGRDRSAAAGPTRCRHWTRGYVTVSHVAPRGPQLQAVWTRATLQKPDPRRVCHEPRKTMHRNNPGSDQ